GGDRDAVRSRLAPARREDGIEAGARLRLRDVEPRLDRTRRRRRLGRSGTALVAHVDLRERDVEGADGIVGAGRRRRLPAAAAAGSTMTIAAARRIARVGGDGGTTSKEEKRKEDGGRGESHDGDGGHSNARAVQDRAIF